MPTSSASTAPCPRRIDVEGPRQAHDVGLDHDQLGHDQREGPVRPGPQLSLGRGAGAQVAARRE